MASSTKPRKKKPATKGRMTPSQMRLSHAIKETYKRLYFLGTSHELPRAVNASIISQHAQGAEYYKSINILLDHLVKIKTTWVMWLGLFFVNEEGNIDVLTGNTAFEESDLVSFGGQFANRSEAMIDAIINEANDPTTTRLNLIGYGYFFAHSDIWEVSDAAEDRFIEWFLPLMTGRTPEDYSPVAVTADEIVTAISKRGSQIHERELTPVGYKELVDQECTS